MARPLVALFGYESSTFTIKMQHVLRLKQIPYTFVAVPTMMPRQQLRDSFHLTYRKIPVLAIDRELYCDTSIICEALEHFFPPSDGYPSLYPLAKDERTYRSLIRGFASYWTDRPLFRVMCGLMPASIWRSQFGIDRGQLIGHKLDPDKLERKLPENLTKLDQQLSMLEPLVTDAEGPWIFSTLTPSLADIALYYELRWGDEIAAGRYTKHITAGQHDNETLEGMTCVFNAERYPGLHSWYHSMQEYFEGLPSTEDRMTTFEEVLEQMKKAPYLTKQTVLLPTARGTIPELDQKVGLTDGALVSVTPDDTGKDNPEEVVIKPRGLGKPAVVETRIHFPRLGFVIRPVHETKL